MPRGDGTGPMGQGSGTGRGKRQGVSQGRGRMGGPFAAGPGGNCVCPSYGATRLLMLPDSPAMQLAVLSAEQK